MIDERAVSRFIDRFTGNGTRPEVIDTFTNGCCYWFAFTLWHRFMREAEESYLVYAPIENHWACFIDDKIYDITGDITSDSKYSKWEDWYAYSCLDSLETDRLFRNCINFGGPEDAKYELKEKEHEKDSHSHLDWPGCRFCGRGLSACAPGKCPDYDPYGDGK